MICIRSVSAVLWRSRLLRAGADLAAAAAQTGKPQYGGTLEIGTVYVTLSALSWDPQDWNWKLNHDTGMYYEQLFAGRPRQERAQGRQAPVHRRRLAAERRDPRRARRALGVGGRPITLVLHLRKGVMFPDKPGVMKARELTAEDVVFSYERLDKSPKKIPTYFDHVAKVEARDPHTVVFRSRSTTPSGTTASAGATTRRSCRRRWPPSTPRTGRTPSAPARSSSSDFVQGNSQTYVEEPDLLGHREDRRRRPTSSRSSTSWCTASSRTRRRSTRRCAPASSTSSRRSAGPRSIS